MITHSTSGAGARRTWVAFLSFFALIGVLKWQAIFLPPIWDESVSVFRAASYLTLHHFDLVGMLREPEYGAHWLSLMSLVTALAASVLGYGPFLWAVLHLLQWAMGAVIGLLLMNLLKPVLGRVPALLSALLFLIMPATLAQLGFMYIEIPLALFSLAAVASHLAGRVGMAVVLCALACFTKEVGFLVAVALGIATLLEAKQWKLGVKGALLYVVPSLDILLITAANQIAAGLHSGSTLAGPVSARLQAALEITKVVYVRYLPDHSVLHALSLLLAVGYLGRVIVLRRRRGAAAFEDPRFRLKLVASLFLLCFLVFYHLLVPVFWAHRNYLPRYLLQALPFIIVLVAFGIRRVFSPRCLNGLLVLLVLLALINRRGLWYPAIPFNDISLAERSEEYLDGYYATRDCLAALEEGAPPEVPIYFTSFTYYLTQDPNLGYVTRRMGNARDVSTAPLFPLRSDTLLPDRFLAVADYPWLGGDRIAALIQNAQAPGSGHDCGEVSVFKHGVFTIRVTECNRKAGQRAQPAATRMRTLAWGTAIAHPGREEL